MKWNLLRRDTFICGLLITLLFISSCSNNNESEPIKEISFYGLVDDGFSYSMRVDYYTTIDSKKCTSFQLFAGRTASSKHIFYKPKIKDGQHSITFPVNELSTTSGCQWQPRLILLCAGNNVDSDENACTQFLDIHRSSTTSGSKKLRDYLQEVGEPLTAWCGEIRPNYWSCGNATGKEDPLKRSYKDIIFPLLVFSEQFQGSYPLERQDAYQLDIHFVAKDD